jgi:hypothetical protein
MDDCTKWPFNPHAAPDTKGDTMRFPANRLREAGATDDEINRLAAEHDQQSEAEKANLLHRLAEIAKGDIVAWLEQLRQAGHFGETIEATGQVRVGLEVPVGKIAELNTRTGEAVILDDLTKAQLLERAEVAGISVPAGATKAAILELLKPADGDLPLGEDNPAQPRDPDYAEKVEPPAAEQDA